MIDRHAHTHHHGHIMVSWILQDPVPDSDEHSMHLQLEEAYVFFKVVSNKHDNVVGIFMGLKSIVPHDRHAAPSLYPTLQVASAEKAFLASPRIEVSISARRVLDFKDDLDDAWEALGAIAYWLSFSFLLVLAVRVQVFRFVAVLACMEVAKCSKLAESLGLTDASWMIKESVHKFGNLACFWSFHLYASMCIFSHRHASKCFYIYLCVFMHLYFYIYLSFYPSNLSVYIYISFYPSIDRSVHLATWLFYRSIYLSIRLSPCLPSYLSLPLFTYLRMTRVHSQRMQRSVLALPTRQLASDQLEQYAVKSNWVSLLFSCKLPVLDLRKPVDLWWRCLHCQHLCSLLPKPSQSQRTTLNLLASNKQPYDTRRTRICVYFNGCRCVFPSAYQIKAPGCMHARIASRRKWKIRLQSLNGKRQKQRPKQPLWKGPTMGKGREREEARKPGPSQTPHQQQVRWQARGGKARKKASQSQKVERQKKVKARPRRRLGTPRRQRRRERAKGGVRIRRNLPQRNVELPTLSPSVTLPHLRTPTWAHRKHPALAHGNWAQWQSRRLCERLAWVWASLSLVAWMMKLTSSFPPLAFMNLRKWFLVANLWASPNRFYDCIP